METLNEILRDLDTLVEVLGVVPTPDIPEAHTLASNAAAALRQVIGPPATTPAWPG